MIYLQCTECSQIEPEPNWLTAQKGKKCKYCGEVEKYELWPSAEISELFETIGKYNQQSFEYGLVASVFISAALELLLERLIFTVAIEGLLYDEVGHLIELLFDTNQGRVRRLQLYKRLGYGSFEKESKEIGYKDFLKHWDEIAEIRNKCVHGDLKECSKITSLLVETIIHESLAVFFKLHNKYNVESLSYDVATKPVKDLARDLEKLKAWKGQVNSKTNRDS
jgi:hypothetical protein